MDFLYIQSCFKPSKVEASGLETETPRSITIIHHSRCDLVFVWSTALLNKCNMFPKVSSNVEKLTVLQSKQCASVHVQVKIFQLRLL